jgi:hypothetical protein
MKFQLVIMLSIACGLSASSQTITTGKANTTGPCSPAVTGTNNQFTITCQGVSDKLGGQLVDLMNRIAKNQLDAQALMDKLDGCLAGIKEVREQQQPWNLTSDQKAQLKNLLSGTVAKVSVNAIGTDRNASLLGLDILEVLRAVGWNTTGGLVTDFTLPPSLVGVTIVVTHANFPEAALLQNALNKIGVHAEGFVDAGKKRVTDDLTIMIAVGAKPAQSE